MRVPAGVLVPAARARTVAEALRLLGRSNGGLPEWARALVAELDSLAASVDTSAVGTPEPAFGMPLRTMSNVSWMGTKQAAERLHCSDGYVRRLIRDGDLVAERVGRGWAIAASDVAAYVARSNR